MDVQFVTSVAPIVRDAHATRSFYQDALGLPATVQVSCSCDGVKARA